MVALAPAMILCFGSGSGTRKHSRDPRLGAPCSAFGPPARLLLSRPPHRTVDSLPFGCHAPSQSAGSVAHSAADSTPGSVPSHRPRLWCSAWAFGVLHFALVAPPVRVSPGACPLVWFWPPARTCRCRLLLCFSVSSPARPPSYSRHPTLPFLPALPPPRLRTRFRCCLWTPTIPSAPPRACT